MTKNEMLGAPNNVLNNFMFGLVMPRITPDTAWQQITNQHATFQAPDGSLLRIDLTPIARNIGRAEDRKILVSEFESGLKRALLTEGHEVLLGYCEVTNQVAKYKAQSWFQFARIMRNVASHKSGGTLRQ
ncbi:hypothetical protein [Rudaea cellulosilytica]|uniref:hypothetical protein n=1 Tax=Rudaea cellulosilytica TaxID=540746 RepID=UPI00036AB5BF|nr:hypothetical protein [Rudaea cellulosilytica]